MLIWIVCIMFVSCTMNSISMLVGWFSKCSLQLCICLNSCKYVSAQLGWVPVYPWQPYFLPRLLPGEPNPLVKSKLRLSHPIAIGQVIAHRCFSFLICETAITQVIGLLRGINELWGINTFLGVGILYNKYNEHWFISEIWLQMLGLESELLLVHALSARISTWVTHSTAKLTPWLWDPTPVNVQCSVYGLEYKGVWCHVRSEPVDKRSWPLLSANLTFQ